ncbi:MAG: hypothetical protein ACE5HQ_10965 [Gemmatimonadota bacterium]
MSKPFHLIGATVGGGLGWWLGAHVGLMTAYMLGVLGTGLGVYVGARIASRYGL